VDISGNTKTVPHDGSEHSAEGFVVTPQGTDIPSTFNKSAVLWKDGETAVAKGTDIGTYYMGMTEDEFSYADENAKNFNITFNLVRDGQLDITPNEDEKEEIITPEKKDDNKDDVLDDVEDDTNGDSGDNGGNGDNGEERSEVKSAVKAPKSGVQTGDSNSLFLYMMVICLGLIILIMMGIIRSKPSRRK
jgi:hypothetical protein